MLRDKKTLRIKRRKIILDKPASNEEEEKRWKRMRGRGEMGGIEEMRRE